MCWKQWKYIYFKGFSPQLFNLENDPYEFKDLGQHPDYSGIRENLKEKICKEQLKTMLSKNIFQEELIFFHLNKV